MDAPDFANFGKAVRRWRLRQAGAPTQAEMAARAGVSDTTWNQAEGGKLVGDRSLAKIGSAFGWRPEDVDLLLAGGNIEEPADAPIDRTDQTDLNSRVARLSPEDQRYIDGIIDALERKRAQP